MRFYSNRVLIPTKYESLLHTIELDQNVHSEVKQVYGGQGGALLWRLVQGIQGGNVGQPAVSYHIPNGGRCGDPPLGDYVGRGVRVTRGVLEGGAESVRAFIRGQLDYSLTPTGQSSKVPENPDGPLQQGETENKCVQDVHHDVPTMLHLRYPI